MDDRRGTGLLTALLLGALLAPGVQAQESQGTLAGRVLTEERGVPVAGVQIRLRAGPSVLTGRDGSYRLSDVPTGMQDFVLVTSRCEFAFGSARAGLDGDWTVNLSLPEAMARGHRARETETQGLVLTTQDLS
ncbi:MAG: carboxypeptidase-like regulatory domain-containing protein, partial [Gemmatimonadota bacterium]